VDPRAKSGALVDPVDSVVKDDLVVADVADAVDRAPVVRKERRHMV